MKAVRVLLLGILFFIGFSSWAQSPEAEDCDPFYEAAVATTGFSQRDGDGHFARVALQAPAWSAPCIRL